MFLIGSGPGAHAPFSLQPYSREVGECLKSETFRTIVARARAQNNPREREPWAQRDHDSIPRSPREDQHDEQEECVR
jgi:hypothetical protein